MGKSMSSLEFNLSKAVEIELTYKAFKLLVPEVFGNNLSFHSANIEDIYAGFVGIPSDNIGIDVRLDRMINTCRRS
jgi:hypothetical protein